MKRKLYLCYIYSVGVVALKSDNTVLQKVELETNCTNEEKLRQRFGRTSHRYKEDLLPVNVSFHTPERLILSYLKCC